MARQGSSIDLQRAHEEPELLGIERIAVVKWLSCAIAEAPPFRSEHSEMGRKLLDVVVPGEGIVVEAVQQDQRRAEPVST